MNWSWGDLTDGSYDCLVIDPAWDFKNYSAKGHLKGAHHHYECMSLDEIMALPVARLARKDCLLLMWTTGWAIADGTAANVVRAWGAKPITELIWRKMTVNGKQRFGPGYRARTMHEPVLLATFGKPIHKPFPSEFMGIAREHSRKPDEFYSMVRAHTPMLPWRADIFSRETRDGFEGFGDQHGLFDGEKKTHPLRSGPRRTGAAGRQAV
jgi:N6-adenosine-specific RNA methylase IME4